MVKLNERIEWTKKTHKTTYGTMFVEDQNSTGVNRMCQNNNTIKTKKFKQINYTERTQIERWHNKDKKTNVEIGKLLGRPEGSINKINK